MLISIPSLFNDLKTTNITFSDKDQWRSLASMVMSLGRVPSNARSLITVQELLKKDSLKRTA
jgi:hypothetical protein